MARAMPAALGEGRDLSGALAQALRNRQGDSTTEPASSSEETFLAIPGCVICHDNGYVRRDVPVGDADFGKAIPCRFCGAYEDRKRRAATARIGRMFGSDLVPKRFLAASFETFPATPRTEPTVQAVRNWVANGNEQSLLIHGPFGVGKTGLGFSAARERLDQGTQTSGIFIPAPDLLGRIKDTFGRKRTSDDESEEDVVQAVRSAGLLFLDDLGSEYGTEWEKVEFFRVIGGRHDAEMPTIFTSNSDLEELRVRLGERTYSRIQEMCWPWVLHLDGDNIRERGRTVKARRH